MRIRPGSGRGSRRRRRGGSCAARATPASTPPHCVRSPPTLRSTWAWPFDPARVEQALEPANGESLGARLARTFFSYWEDPTTGPALVALLRSAMTNPQAATLLREVVVHELFARRSSQFEVEDPDMRVELAAAQLVGVAVLRNVLRVEPNTQAPIDELVAWVGPTLDGYIRPG